MWLVFSGPLGSAKSRYSKFADGFQVIDEPLGFVPEGEFERLRSFMELRLRIQREAERRTERERVITFRSYWDAAEVFVRASLATERISLSEAQELLGEYERNRKGLIPPDAIVYMRPRSEVTARAYMQEKGIDEHEFYFTAVREEYERFVERLAIPVVEIDTADAGENVKDAIEFGVASLTSAQIVGLSLWKRFMFRSERFGGVL